MASRLIVLAEDNAADVYLIKEALRQRDLSCQVLAIGDGEEMMHFIDAVDGDNTRRLPDLVLLDLNLPKRSGGEILAHLQKSSRCRPVPVIVRSPPTWTIS
ncbi:MAG: response regulator [Acidobacteria bacterium]|nr:response regulator [Acidobacteriota bacterium]